MCPFSCVRWFSPWLYFRKACVYAGLLFAGLYNVSAFTRRGQICFVLLWDYFRSLFFAELIDGETYCSFFLNLNISFALGVKVVIIVGTLEEYSSF